MNAHAANLGWNTPSMLESLLRSDLLLRDGIGVKLGLKAFRRPPGLNMNGTDFIPKIARAYKGRRAALFGTRRRGWTQRVGSWRQRAWWWWPATRASRRRRRTWSWPSETKPELIILAMGMPKQEDIAVRLRERLTHPVLIVNGGAILDFLGGKVTRAPGLMRNIGHGVGLPPLLGAQATGERYVWASPSSSRTWP